MAFSKDSLAGWRAVLALFIAVPKVSYSGGVVMKSYAGVMGARCVG